MTELHTVNSEIFKAFHIHIAGTSVWIDEAPFQTLLLEPSVTCLATLSYIIHLEFTNKFQDSQGSHASQLLRRRKLTSRQFEKAEIQSVQRNDPRRQILCRARGDYRGEPPQATTAGVQKKNAGSRGLGVCRGMAMALFTLFYIVCKSLS